MDLVVKAIHVSILGFMVIVPLVSNNPDLLLVHLAASISILFHWILNNDTCALTILEMALKNDSNKERSFINTIMSPVYSEPSEVLIKLVSYAFLILISIKNSYYLGSINYSFISKFYSVE